MAIGRNSLLVTACVLLAACGSQFSASNATGGGDGVDPSGGSKSAEAGGARTTEAGESAGGGAGMTSSGGAGVAGSSDPANSGAGGAIVAGGASSIGGATTAGGGSSGGGHAAGTSGAGSCLTGWKNSTCDKCATLSDQSDQASCANVVTCCEQQHVDCKSACTSCGCGFQYDSVAADVYACKCL